MSGTLHPANLRSDRRTWGNCVTKIIPGMAYVGSVGTERYCQNWSYSLVVGLQRKKQV